MSNARLRQFGLVAACVAALVACGSDSPTAPSDSASSGGGTTTPTTLSVELSIGTVSSLRRGLTEIGDAEQARRIAVSGQVSAQGGSVSDLSGTVTVTVAGRSIVSEEMAEFLRDLPTIHGAEVLRFDNIEFGFDAPFDPAGGPSGQVTVEVTGRDVSGGIVSASATADLAPDDTVAVTSTCAPNPTTACAFDRRFKIEVDWETSSDSGMGSVVSGRRFFDGAEFSLANSNTSDLLVQLLDRCSQNDHFWVFSAATTDVGHTITVTDTATGVRRPYTHPLGSPLQPITDTAAFATCP